jgi:hypothetical protein
MESNPGRQRKSTWGLKDEEYVADFCLVSRRVLTLEEHRVFRYHFLLRADWKLCCAKLNFDRGSFFHEIYRIEQKLGRTFRELEPHPLFPVDQYFNGTGKEKPAIALLMPIIADDEDEEEHDEVIVKRRRRKVLKFPIKQAA